MIARYITHHDLELYIRLGWEVSYYGERGDGLQCYIASFTCTEDECPRT
jgi:hypothetical protein